MINLEVPWDWVDFNLKKSKDKVLIKNLPEIIKKIRNFLKIFIEKNTKVDSLDIEESGSRKVFFEGFF